MRHHGFNNGGNILIEVARPMIEPPYRNNPKRKWESVVDTTITARPQQVLACSEWWTFGGKEMEWNEQQMHRLPKF
jgi:hypothetical protein